MREQIDKPVNGAPRRTSVATIDVFEHEEHEAILRALGENIRRERMHCGLTQDALEKRAFLRYGRVSRIECAHAKLTLFTLLTLADSLRLSPSQLLEGVPAPRRERSLDCVLKAVGEKPGITTDALASGFDVAWDHIHLLTSRLCADRWIERRGNGYWLPRHAREGGGR